MYRKYSSWRGRACIEGRGNHCGVRLEQSADPEQQEVEDGVINSCVKNKRNVNVLNERDLDVSCVAEITRSVFFYGRSSRVVCASIIFDHKEIVDKSTKEDETEE